MDARDDDPNDADAAGLPNRLLRKAETAIQGRTSRVLVVIERCTDEHNYSAVIRTAEALGVQHVWLIDPVDVDLDAVGSDDDDGGGGDDGERDDDEEEEEEEEERAQKKKPGRRTRPWSRTRHGDAARDAHKLFARRANEFTTIREFATTAACVAALREDGRTIWATDLSQRAVCLTESALRAARGDDATSASASVVPEKLAIVFGTESGAFVFVHPPFGFNI